jgi:hypothetical protein
MSILLGRSIWQKGLNVWTRGLPSISICFAPPNWHRPCQIGGLEDYLPLKHVHVQGLCYLLYYGGFLKWGYPKVSFFSKNHMVIHDLDDLGVALFSEAPETRWRVLFIVYFCHWDDMLKIGLTENMAPQDQMIHHISIMSPLWSPFYNIRFWKNPHDCPAIS